MTVHNLLRILILKRTEPSIYALKKTIERYISRLEYVDGQILLGKIIRISDIDKYMNLLEKDKLSIVEEQQLSDQTEVADPAIYNIDAFKSDIHRDHHCGVRFAPHWDVVELTQMKILVIAAHPDDEIIGVGGTLCKHVDAGDEVKVIILGEGKTSRLDTYQEITETQIKASRFETESALARLGIKNFQIELLPNNRFDRIERLDLAKIISRHISDFRPERVYTHHIGDLNIDHRRCSEAVVIACRPIENSCVKNILMFETLSSTEMGGYGIYPVFLPNYFVNIEKQLDRKLEAIACYKSEVRGFPHPRSLESIKINAQLWGTKTNISAAEAFFLFRGIY